MSSTQSEDGDAQRESSAEDDAATTDDVDTGYESPPDMDIGLSDDVLYMPSREQGAIQDHEIVNVYVLPRTFGMFSSFVADSQANTDYESLRNFMYLHASPDARDPNDPEKIMYAIPRDKQDTWNRIQAAIESRGTATFVTSIQHQKIKDIAQQAYDKLHERAPRFTVSMAQDICWRLLRVMTKNEFNFDMTSRFLAAYMEENGMVAEQA